MKKQQPASKAPITMAEIDALMDSLGLTEAYRRQVEEEDNELAHLSPKEIFQLGQQMVADYRASHHDCKQKTGLSNKRVNLFQDDIARHTDKQ